MTIIHTGFDGVDLALKTTVPIELVEFLEEGKATAQELMTDVWGTYAGLDIQSGQSGKRGGYAFTFRVYEFGATWFAKKPRASDPWGLYVSIGSRELALNGLEKTRQTLDALLVQLGFQLPHDGVSINRVDFAVDILAPGFVLDPDAFVFHSRANRKAIAEFETVETNGHSGRTTSVTIGKMPGRQVILYDKREEVLKRRKQEWPMIWNANLKAAGLDPLDLSDRTTSQVWRIRAAPRKRSPTKPQGHSGMGIATRASASRDGSTRPGRDADSAFNRQQPLALVLPPDLVDHTGYRRNTPVRAC